MSFVREATPVYVASDVVLRCCNHQGFTNTVAALLAFTLTNGARRRDSNPHTRRHNPGLYQLSYV